jgi:fumarate hydratase subunit beta
MAKKITLPLSDEILKDLKAGDNLLLTGVIYVARDAAHKRMVESLDQGNPLPFRYQGGDRILHGAQPGSPRGGYRLGRSHHQWQDGCLCPTLNG